MSSNIQASIVRGADGRLFVVSPEGAFTVAETVEARSASVQAGTENQDHHAGRFAVTPGV